MPEPILIAEGVRKVYRSGGADVVALKGLDLTVPQGEFLAVMGPSGLGQDDAAQLPVRTRRDRRRTRDRRRAIRSTSSRTRSARGIAPRRWASSSRRST